MSKILSFFFSIRHDKKQYKKYQELTAETDYVIDQLGYIIGVFGPIGAGKSTSASAITSTLERKIINNILSRNSYIRTMICDLDFNKINVAIMKLSEDPFMTPEKAFNMFKDKLEDFLYILSLKLHK